MRFIERLKNSAEFGPLVAWHQTIPPRPADHARTTRPLPPALRGVLGTLGIDRLYRHQAEAIDLARGRPACGDGHTHRQREEPYL